MVKSRPRPSSWSRFAAVLVPVIMLPIILNTASVANGTTAKYNDCNEFRSGVIGAVGATLIIIGIRKQKKRQVENR